MANENNFQNAIYQRIHHRMTTTFRPIVGGLVCLILMLVILFQTGDRISAASDSVSFFVPPTLNSVSPNPLYAPATMIGAPFFGTVTILGSDLQGGDITTNGPLTMTGTSTVNGGGTSISRNYQIGCCTPTQGQVFSFTVTTPMGSASIQDTIALAPVISMGQAAIAFNEGNSGTTAYTFNLIKSGTSTQTVTLNYLTTGGTAVPPGDYTAIPTTPISFAPGETSKTVTVFVNGDTTVEPDETFNLALNGPISNGTIGTNSQSLGVIFNDDTDIRVAVSPSSVPEDGGNLTYTFTRTGLLTPALVVNFTIAGTATAGVDYAVSGATINGANGTINFAAGAATAVMTIDPDPRSDHRTRRNRNRDRHDRYRLQRRYPVHRHRHHLKRSPNHNRRHKHQRQRPGKPSSGHARLECSGWV